ncbi:hypothetical protein [Methanolapillus millepedarum]|uniref:Uncharacterized protein n=1 Tax=Methanolapillus millepedarum TaxID=3028296 RepID=A0AA96ZVS4_9EURY|nr:hypothetical protein MsAc7_07040 [Methanosarcinaceae archaeon Ac7]
MKTVSLFGKEYPVSQVIAGAILIYFWGLKGLLKLPLPDIIPDSMVSWVTWAALGFFVSFSFLPDNSAELLYLTAKLRSKKIICNYGVFSWDGSSYQVTAGGMEYSVFYEGVNAFGIVERGNKVFICPTDLISFAGYNRLIKADLKETVSVPVGLERFLSGIDYCLYGVLPNTEFGYVSAKAEHMEDLLKTLYERNQALTEANAGYMKMLMDAGTINKMNGSELDFLFEKELGGDS